MRKFYVAYGSNLNKRQMKYRCPNALAYSSGTLKNYELLFKGSKTGSYATVEPRLGASVPVGVWLIDERDERSLDRYEGFPTFYYKTHVDVDLDCGETINALVYIMHEDRPRGVPAEYYVATCLEGYADFGLDKFDFLEAYLNSMMKEEVQ